MPNLETRLRLLQKPVWNFKDIMVYTNYKQSNACRIKTEAIKKCNGKVPFNTNVVKTSSVLKLLYGTTREEEIETLCKFVPLYKGLTKELKDEN